MIKMFNAKAVAKAAKKVIAQAKVSNYDSKLHMEITVMLERDRETRDKAEWEKAVTKFLQRNNISIPQDKVVWEDLLYYEVDLLEIGTINNIPCVWRHGYDGGEPSSAVYNASDWEEVGVCYEGTDFEWQYYRSRLIAITGSNLEAERDSDATDNKVTDNATIEEKKEEEETMVELKVLEITADNGDVRGIVSIEELCAFAVITKIAKIQDANYMDKAQMLAVATASGMETSKKTTRKEALEYIAKVGNERYQELKAQMAAQTQAAAEAQRQEQAKQAENEEKKRFFIALRKRIIEQATKNSKSGHGYTISAKFLKYLIFEVRYGIKSFIAYEAKNKGKPEFEARMKNAAEIAKWLIGQGFLKGVTFRAVFDVQTRDGLMHFDRACYAPEFDAPQSTKAKMIPVKDVLYKEAVNVKRITTTYAVMWK